MTDLTHPPSRRWRAHRRHKIVVFITIVAVASISAAGLARADGDPASDVLVSQPLFLPQDSAITAGQQAQLATLLAAATRAGYQLRVALIASPADLGSVTELWRQPQNYARFLGQELSLLYRGPLLVVMPNGYGIYRSAGTPAGDQAALATVAAPGTELATATLTAIQRLAAASGHTLQLPRITAPKHASSSDTLSWLAFVIGIALIAMAWTASLRTRPLSRTSSKITPT